MDDGDINRFATFTLAEPQASSPAPRRRIRWSRIVTAAGIVVFCGAFWGALGWTLLHH